MKNQVFHIAGGGIAGLASALAVAASGNSAFVMEKASSFEAVGAGLQLGPNAVRALQHLGAWDAVEPITSSPPEIIIRDGRSGKTLKRFALGKKFEARFGAPYRVAHRADLLQALLDVAKSKPSITIQTNAEVIANKSFDGFALIAADGVWSKTRDALFPRNSAIISKDIIHRSLTDEVINDCVNLWLYPGGHVVHYPAGQTSKLNLVAVTQGLDVNSHFKNACGELQEILSNKAWSQWQAAYTPPLRKWNQDNTLLIGDAAHGTLPYLAQGAAMALEDAAKLIEFLFSEFDAEIAFNKLSAARSSRTQRLHKASLKAGYIYHLKGAAAETRNAMIQFIPSQLQLAQLAWVYNWTNSD